MSQSVLIPMIIVAFVVVFAAMWLAITALLGMISGWNAIERMYPDLPERPVATLSYQSGRMRGVNFNHCLRFDICATGLRVSVLRFLGPFQRPFFVPWGQIRTEPENALFVRYVRLALGLCNEAGLAISQRTFDKIAANSPLRAP